MQSISTYTDALRAIWNRSGYDRGFISNPFAGDDAARLGLTRTQSLLEQAGYAELPYAIVHVAGSKGKGSTCTMIDAILRAADIRTGRYLSPHLHSFRERFVVDNILISESDFTSLTRQCIGLAHDIEQHNPGLGQITAFELTTAMALAWFAQQNCQAAVVEVGMGGELDSTNIVTPTVSVITTLDYEHTAILGSTMAEIAGNKAGIIKPNRPVLTSEQPTKGMEVIAARATEHDAPLLIANRDWQVEGIQTDFTFTHNGSEISGLHCSLVGSHQVENAGLAIAAALTLQTCRPDLDIDSAAIRSGIASATLPGRFEQIDLPSGQIIVIDGAHTPASTAALSQAVRERFPYANATLVIGMLADKQSEAILLPLRSIASRWIATSPKNPRATLATEVQRAINAIGAGADIAATVAESIELAKGDGSELIVITGSFTIAAEARVALGLPTVSDPPM